ncbi:MAG: hypothetical protein IJY65_02025 [Clostridia bacterium]|nr:hypothetical protein [Clostridia bacterium]
MKKRILAMLLVVATLVLTLASCGFNYETSDLSAYTEFDKAAFVSALEKLVIEDADFTTDEDVRDQKVRDDINKALAELVDDEAKVLTGVIGANDLLYYCYYCTATIPAEEEGGEEKNIVVFASNMEESKATKLQLGLSDATDLQKAIEGAIATIDITDYIYSTETSTDYVLKYGDEVYISYSYNYSYEKDGVDLTGKGSVSYEKITLVDDGDEAVVSFSDKIVGNKIGASIADFTINEQRDADEALEEVKYTGAKVAWVVESGEELTVKDTTYTETKKVTATDGSSYDLKNIELTYHVYPVYSLDVPTLDGRKVFEILDDKLTATLLDCFENEELIYKDTVGVDHTMPSLIEELVTYIGDVESIQTDVDDAQDEYDEAVKADKGGTTESDAKNKLDELKADLEEAEKEKEAKLVQILKIEGINDILVEDYEKYVYETLEAEYNEAIEKLLAAEAWKLVEESVKVNSLPADMVNKVYDRLIENHQYTFYNGTYSPEGSSSSSSTEEEISNYKAYDQSFDKYLMGQTGTKTKDEAYAAVRKEAEENVTPVIKMYAVVRAYDDLLLTDEEYDEFLDGNVYYSYYESYLGENSIRYAAQLDKLLDYILESETKDGKVTYKHLKYTLGADEEDAEDGE